MDTGRTACGCPGGRSGGRPAPTGDNRAHDCGDLGDDANFPNWLGSDPCAAPRRALEISSRHRKRRPIPRETSGGSRKASRLRNRRETGGCRLTETPREAGAAGQPEAPALTGDLEAYRQPGDRMQVRSHRRPRGRSRRRGRPSDRTPSEARPGEAPPSHAWRGLVVVRPPRLARALSKGGLSPARPAWPPPRSPRSARSPRRAGRAPSPSTSGGSRRPPAGCGSWPSAT